MGTFQPGRNTWRIEHARRAAVLIDAGAFFGAVRAALLQARRNVFIIGWDLDSRTRLVGEDCERMTAGRTRCANSSPAWSTSGRDLTVHLLAWDFAVLYALEREPFPSLKLGWNTPARMRFRLDNALPLGASHHQKIIVVDDALAFSGGLDLTIRRWDTCRHDLDNPHRRDPAGAALPSVPRRPDDGRRRRGARARRACARALGTRHRRACVRRLADDRGRRALAARRRRRTSPMSTSRSRARCRSTRTSTEVREVEALFYDMIARAERTIYIENQFLTCTAHRQGAGAAHARRSRSSRS